MINGVKSLTKVGQNFEHLRLESNHWYIVSTEYM